MVIRREFEPHQKLTLFYSTSHFTLVAQYWLVSGMDLSVIYICKIACFTAKINKYRLSSTQNTSFHVYLLNDFTNNRLA